MTRNLQPAIDIIKEFEGLYLTPYKDPVGVPTIGFGTIKYPNGQKVKLTDPPINYSQAEAYLMKELLENAKYVDAYIKAPMNDNQFCAILSFTYNRGAGRLRDSKIRKELNARNYDKAAYELENFKVNKTDNLKGLVRRRKAEAALFRKPVSITIKTEGRPTLVLNQPKEKNMSKIVPSKKPALHPDEVLAIVKANKVKDKVCLVGIRGYYLDSMGAKGKNDRGAYDDAAFWVSPDGVIAFNFNADASRYRLGKGSGAEKGMASLNPGVWRYKTGIHYGAKPHPAFRQAAPVKITRDGTNGNYQDVLNSSINIHKGGANGTSSLGCQTVPTSQWDAFKELGYMLLNKHGQKDFAYVLIEETNRRKGNLTV